MNSQQEIGVEFFDFEEMVYVCFGVPTGAGVAPTSCAQYLVALDILFIAEVEVMGVLLLLERVLQPLHISYYPCFWTQSIQIKSYTFECLFEGIVVEKTKIDVVLLQN
jgi:hypothetical protein